VDGSPRLQFSLATLLLLVTWSAALLSMNVLPRVSLYKVAAGGMDFGFEVSEDFERHVARWGWPCRYAVDSSLERASLSRLPPHGQIDYRALFLDTAVGVLIVAALTWATNQLLRRVGARLRRRSAAKEQALDSPAE
jgi:hypothetical protein